MPPNIATAISRVKGAKQAGIRTGHWLTREQAEDLISAPNATENKGKRDRALLAVLIGCGLRRREAACAHRQAHSIARCPMGNRRSDRQRRARPHCSDAELDQERHRFLDRSCGHQGGLVFRAMNRGGRVTATSMTPRAICQVVRRFGDAIGAPKLAPHDLRRTFAKLAHKGRSGLEQIQLSLGHASITTTERYLGVRQDLNDAPCDHLGLTIEMPR